MKSLIIPLQQIVQKISLFNIYKINYLNYSLVGLDNKHLFKEFICNFYPCKELICNNLATYLHNKGNCSNYGLLLSKQFKNNLYKHDLLYTEFKNVLKFINLLENTYQFNNISSVSKVDGFSDKFQVICLYLSKDWCNSPYLLSLLLLLINSLLFQIPISYNLETIEDCFKLLTLNTYTTTVQNTLNKLHPLLNKRNQIFINFNYVSMIRNGIVALVNGESQDEITTQKFKLYCN